MARTELKVFLVYLLMIQIQALTTSNYFSKPGVCVCTTHYASPKKYKNQMGTVSVFVPL